MMLLKQEQVQFRPASSRYMYFLLISVIFLGCIPREVTPLFLTKGWTASPANESINIKRGETLSMNCSASGRYLSEVWWAKSIGSGDNWLTRNSIVKTNDPRVSIANRSFDEHSTFSLQITDITTSDAGRYTCYAVWGAAPHSFGYIFVSVQYFPAEIPICATNGSDRISTESIAVWCDTAIGNPAVTITWRVDNSDKEVTGNVYRAEPPQHERVRSVVKLGEHLQNQVLVCTVTSSAFPGQTRSCYIGPILYAGSMHTTTDLPASPLISDETQTGYIAAAMGIPAAFVVGFLVSLACTRKRQQGDKRRRNDPRRETATPVGENQPPDMELAAIPYSVTTMPDDDVMGTRVSVHAYETRVGTADADNENAAYEQMDRNIGKNEVTSSYLELQ